LLPADGISACADINPFWIDDRSASLRTGFGFSIEEKSISKLSNAEPSVPFIMNIGRTATDIHDLSPSADRHDSPRPRLRERHRSEVLRACRDDGLCPIPSHL
jgi:hypothetical protein